MSTLWKIGSPEAFTSRRKVESKPIENSHAGHCTLTSVYVAGCVAYGADPTVVGGRPACSLERGWF